MSDFCEDCGAFDHLFWTRTRRGMMELCRKCSEMLDTADDLPDEPVSGPGGGPIAPAVCVCGSVIDRASAACRGSPDDDGLQYRCQSCGRWVYEDDLIVH